MAEGTELLRTALGAGAAVEAVFVGAEGAADRRRGALAPRPCARARGSSTWPPGCSSGWPTPSPPSRSWPSLPCSTPPLEDLDGGRLVVVCVDVRDPGNAGTVLRRPTPPAPTPWCAAGGPVDPYNPKTVRASAGSLFHVPVVVGRTPTTVARRLWAAGLPAPGPRWSRGGRTTRTSTGAARPRWCSATRQRACPRRLLDAVDGAVAIPMARRAESLNVRRGLRRALLRGAAPAPAPARRRPVTTFGGVPERTRRRRAGVEPDALDRPSAAASAGDDADLAAWTSCETAVLGKRSALARAHRALGALAPDARREAGRRLHEARAALEALAGRAAGRAGGGRAGRRAWRPTGSTSPRWSRPRSTPLSRGHLHLVSPDPRRARGRLRRHGLRGGRGPRGRDRLVQLRGAEHPARPTRPGACTTRSTSTSGEPETVLLRTHTSPGADPPHGGGGGRGHAARSTP